MARCTVQLVNETNFNASDTVCKERNVANTFPTNVQRHTILEAHQSWCS